MTVRALPHTAIRRITAAVMQREIQRLRGQPAERPDDRPVDAPLDSLERMGVAAALGEMFELSDIVFDINAADSLDDWAEGLDRTPVERLTVHTSGSTGAPQRHSHAVAELWAEAETLAQHFTTAGRIIALVPADHLYGLVWTALLPVALDVPVIDGQITALPELRPDDLIVGVPEHWAALSRFRRDWPNGVIGINSGGPLDSNVGQTLLASGLSRLVDVYGTSETSAVGLRDVPQAGYALLPRWQLAQHDDGLSLRDRDGQLVALPDRIRAIDTRRIALDGRHDHAVQVGGINVYPTHIAGLLAAHDGVSEAAVRLGDDGRLKAFVVTIDGHAPTDLESRLRRFAIECLTPAERPVQFRFGSALPSNDMGKPADWD
ncbi:class I adenylate-forming enzyme family protein [Salinisphaera sp. Q1T1-3]|uniref:class I adenylate-forming enzyme family protein n=1 Tax=Salinisphaera sp. Q1T1-3 TaxID=2321229 RepID=UPI001314380F|nr:class I adenylate-forming enzyme family protein [Salinisphaera sp. Q1T1-3]